MNKKDLLNLMVSDYKKFFQPKDLDEYETKMVAFLNENEELSIEDFFEKMKKEMPAMKTIDLTISRIYLSKIATNIDIITKVVLIFVILSIVVGIIVAASSAYNL
jgi:uncharacterized membrane protein